MRVVRTGGSAADEVVFETPDDVEVRIASGPDGIGPSPRRTRGSGRAPGDDALIAALTDSGLNVAADARLVPPAGRGVRTVRAGSGAARISVAVGPDESAVVLVESDEGTYAWLRPDDLSDGRRATRSASASNLTFTLAGPAQRTRATRSATGWLFDRLTKPIRTLVLRFAVRLTIDAVMARIEGHNATGLVRVESADPRTWLPGSARIPAPPADRPMRVLLLVHGTFSNTAGSFGHLCAHPAGRFFLDSALSAYDVVLGYDHKTLADSVEANAELMADALADLPKGSQVDAIAYSRGGLVLRVLFDRLLANSRSDLRLGRAIFVGCTNAGTNLANPENWEALADLYTNVIMAGARVVTLLAAAPLDPFVRLGIKTVGEFVQMLPQVAIEERRVPGLASMRPKSETVRGLDETTPRDGEMTAYHAITSNFAPRFEPRLGLTKELAQMLLDRVTNDLWRGEDNDLVVDTESMTSFGVRADWIDSERIYHFGDVETIYHTVYFTAPETCERLLAWLGLPPLPEALVVPRRTRQVKKPILREIVVGIPPESFGPAPARRSTRRPVAIPRGELEGSAPAASSRTRRRKAPNSRPEPDSCHVAASMPETPPLSRPALLEVILSREEIARVAGETRADGVIRVAEEADLSVIVTARQNCETVGNHKCDVRPPKPGAPVILGFEVRGMGPGAAEVWADIYQSNRRLSRLVLQPVFVSTGDIAVSALVGKEVDPPIVDLRVLEEGDENRWRLRFLVSAPDLGIEDDYFSEWQIINKTDYIASLYKRLEDTWAASAGRFESLMSLIRAEGADLFRSLFPEPMQRRIWDLREKIGSLQVFAQEPSIPWEIAFVAEPGKPLSRTEGKFLAELGLTRWTTNIGVAPARLRLRHGKALYCIPDYLDSSLRLPSQADEAEMMRDLLGAQAVEPHIDPVLGLIGRTDGADFDVLHFACHGSADPKRIWESGLLLEGYEEDGEIRREELSLAVVRNYADLARDGVKPLVFLNACQTGVGGYGLSGAGGLAQAFVRNGAGLFVGTLWSVADRTALTFSTTFYKALKNGRTVVEAAKAAREAAKAENESTWLAYSVYGHPYARAAL